MNPAPASVAAASGAVPGGPAPRVVVAANCLRGTAGALEVATAMADGLDRVLPHIGVRVLALADGGDGTLEVLAQAGLRRPVNAQDPLGRSRPTSYLRLPGSVAVLETAAVCGLGALAVTERQPMTSDSFGVGQVLLAAVSEGAREIWLGLGGTAVLDGGAGALAALGARFVDAAGRAVPPQPATLANAVRVDLAPARQALAGVRLRLLSDVDTPLGGNPEWFGAQKGLTDQDRAPAAHALRRLRDLLIAADPVDGPAATRNRFDAAWFGAGGGIGFGLAAVATTTAGSGAARLLALIDPDEIVGTAALALTAEGRVDAGTWRGKLPGTVAMMRAARGLPTTVVTASATGPTPDPLITVRPLADPAPSRMLRGVELHDALALAAGRAASARFRTEAPA